MSTKKAGWWPAKKVRSLKTAELIPYARNSRQHSQEQVAQIAASIREWGWTVPILVDEEMTIIAGHGRVMAAQMLEIDRVPAIVAEGWSDAQKRAYVIADNKLTINGSWDYDQLSVELEELRDDDDFDHMLTGFSEDEIDDLLTDHDFPPGDEDDQGSLGDKPEKIVTCPHCGEEFDANA